MREGFAIGPLTIHFYGVIIMLGALAGAYLVDRLAKFSGEDHEVVWDSLPWLLVGGIIGARIWHILTPPASMVAQGITVSYYLTHPLDAIAIWRGGLGIPGAVFGGVIALLIYTRKKNISFLKWADLIVPGLALAQAIGRWGNFVNQELYGAPSNLPWAIFIDPAHRLAGMENVTTYHPLFLYESIWNLINAGLLVWIGRRFASQLKPGDIFLSYLVTYPVMRFLLEFVRLDPSQIGGINANQTLMASIAIIALAILVYKHLKPAKPSDLSTESTSEE